MLISSVFHTEYIESVKSGEKFESLASQFSDCSSAKNGGDLGPFGRGVFMLDPHLVVNCSSHLRFCLFSIELFLHLDDSKK